MTDPKPTDRDQIDTTARQHGWLDPGGTYIYTDHWRRNGQTIRIDYSRAGRITWLRINGQTIERDRRATALTKLQETP